MATKYILDPSGNIIKVVDGKISEDQELGAKIPADKSDYLETVSQGQNAELNESEIDFFGLGFVEGQDLDPSYIVGQVSNDPSFNFLNEDIVSNEKESYKPFNSFLKKDDHDGPMPKAFADEFEILTGMRFRSDEFADSASTSLLLLTYLVESIVKIISVEAIVLANKGLLDNNGNQSRTAERYKLRLGKYDFTEFEIFTDYVFNVLNYPQEQSTALERLDAYFIGVSAWLSPDSMIDLNELAREKSSPIALNSIDFATNNKSLSESLGGFLPVATAATEILAATLSNTTSLNRVRLLLRKFYQERHWDKNILYKAKNQNYFLDFFTELNYYNFKFIVERVQVGLKILNKYYYDDSYLQTRQKDSPLNRVSAARSQIKAKFDISIPDNDDNKKGVYFWDNTKSDTAYKSQKAGQTTRIRALPQALNMNYSFYRALALNGKKTLDLSDDIAQNFFYSEERRLPSELVKEIENHLESEYMPFYFHDLRTNELLSFHAFIENISDSFSPEYNSASGFGRIDDVKSYVKTTRNINLTFILAATSEADHDMMWYQINKIVAMVYPQWSDAFDAASVKDNTNSGSFKYPFTQVPTASPLIRLRVGDVIKSNYSRTNISRLHGIGDRDQDKGIDTNPDERNSEKVKTAYNAIKEIKKNKEEQIKNLLIESNKSGYKNFENKLKKIELDSAKDIKQRRDTISEEVAKSTTIYDTKRIYYLQPGLYRTTSEDGSVLGFKEPKLKTIKIDNEVIIKDNFNKNLDFTTVTINEGIYQEFIVVTDISKIRVLNPDPLVGKKDSITLLEETNKIMQPKIDGKSNNPIVRAYESGMSRGLAGFITNLDVSYNESTWETSRIGSKAPMMVKINIGFSPIHDIPPGLDHNGMLRAPVYNVGRINNQFFGDPHDGNKGHGKGFMESEEKYNKIKDS